MFYAFNMNMLQIALSVYLVTIIDDLYCLFYWIFRTTVQFFFFTLDNTSRKSRFAWLSLVHFYLKINNAS